MTYTICLLSVTNKPPVGLKNGTSLNIIEGRNERFLLYHTVPDSMTWHWCRKDECMIAHVYYSLEVEQLKLLLKSLGTPIATAWSTSPSRYGWRVGHFNIFYRFQDSNHRTTHLNTQHNPITWGLLIPIYDDNKYIYIYIYWGYGGWLMVPHYDEARVLPDSSIPGRWASENKLSLHLIICNHLQYQWIGFWDNFTGKPHIKNRKINGFLQ